MIAGLKPYTDYKDSGLPWLGQIPTHWDVRRVKTVLREVDRRSSEGLEPLLSLRMHAGLVDHHALGGRPIPPSALIGYKRVLPGEIVMNRMRASAGLFAAATSDGLVSPDYAIFRPVHQINVAYAVQLFRTPAMAAVFRLESTGLGTGESGFLRLYSDQFGRLAIPTPPLAEQAVIVRFLDWANGRLDRTIRAKRKVIALLTEQKQVIIHRAVTRGLEPNVALKPSGVSWFNQIPHHWDIRRLSSLATFSSGKAHEQFIDLTGKYVCVTARFVSTSGRSRKFSTKNLSPATRRDVLMVMSDLPNGRALGRSYLVADDAAYAVNQRVCKLTPHSIEPRLLAYFANRNYHLLRQDDGMNQTHLSNYDFKTMPVLVPPICEQIAISDYLDHAISDLDSVVDRLQRECDLLSEYKTRLIADVVTGKLDVREAAARLPDEAAPEPVEDIADDTEPEDEEAIA